MKPEQVKLQADTLISVNLIPLFPDYIKRTRLADVIVEQALQLAANVYEGKLYEETGEPYLIHILEWLKLAEPYVYQLPMDEQRDVLAALMLYNVYKSGQVSPNKLRKEFGDYVMSLIAPEDEEHAKSIRELFAMFDELNIPQDVRKIFDLLKG